MSSLDLPPPIRRCFNCLAVQSRSPKPSTDRFGQQPTDLDIEILGCTAHGESRLGHFVKAAMSAGGHLTSAEDRSPG